MIWTLIVFRLSLDGQCSLTIADFFIVVFLQPCWFSFTFISYFYLCRCQDICWTASRPQGRSKERLQLTASQRPDFLPTSWSRQIWTLHFASKEICRKPFSHKCRWNSKSDVACWFFSTNAWFTACLISTVLRSNGGTTAPSVGTTSTTSTQQTSLSHYNSSKKWCSNPKISKYEIAYCYYALFYTKAFHFLLYSTSCTATFNREESLKIDTSHQPSLILTL